jgi:hypothetical protein
MKKEPALDRCRPDILTLELANVLSTATWFEFKALFLVLHANLRARNAAHGGEEMLRHSAYEKLQTPVLRGGVAKRGKKYCGEAFKLAVLKEHLAAEHCRNLLDAVEDSGPPHLKCK